MSIQNITKVNVKNSILKLIIYTIGIFIFCFGLTFVVNTLVGVSPSDMLIMAVNNALNLDDYTTLLTITNVVIFVVALITYGAKLYTKKKRFEYTDILYYASQLVPTLTIGPIISLFENVLVSRMELDSLAYYLRVFIFIGGWLLFCIGGSIMVWANIMQQSYNSIVLDMTVLFKMKFMTARVILDLMFAITGLLLCLLTRIDKIWDIFNVGTIFLTLLTGPFMQVILKVLNKIKY